MESESRRKKVLVVSLSNLARDPRVYRQILALRSTYIVYSAGKEASEAEDEFICFHENLARPSKTQTILFAARRGFLFYRFLVEIFNRINKRVPLPFAVYKLLLLVDPNTQRFLSAVRKVSFDLVIANEISSLVQAYWAKGNAKFLYDAHEYSLDEYDNAQWRRSRRPFIETILKRYLKKVDKMITVSSGIAKEYQGKFGISLPDVVANSPQYKTLEPKPPKHEKVRLVHHGVAAKLRMIEEMIRTVDLLDSRFELDLYLMKGNGEYYEYLEKLAGKCGRIRFCDPVPMTCIPEMLNEYDLGLALFSPRTINLRYVLPNKFFEFIQGRLGVAIGPSPEMASYVRKYDLGVISEDFTAESLAKSLNALTSEDIMRFKSNAHKHAYELSAEPQMEKLRSIVESLIGK